MKFAQFTVDQINRSEAIEQRKVVTLEDNKLCVITASPEKSSEAAWDVVGQKSGSNLAKWSELFGINL